MEKLFEMRESTADEDLYKMLGCDESSSVSRQDGTLLMTYLSLYVPPHFLQDEQIATEFKQLARRYHPDKASEADKATGIVYRGVSSH